jgi:hypothetical protein
MLALFPLTRALILVAMPKEGELVTVVSIVFFRRGRRKTKDGVKSLFREDPVR